MIDTASSNGAAKKSRPGGPVCFATDNSNLPPDSCVPARTLKLTPGEKTTADLLFDPAKIDWGSDSDNEMILDDGPPHEFPPTPCGDSNVEISWDNLSLGIQRIIIHMLNDLYPFPKATETLLRLTRAHIQEFLAIYISEWHVWQSYMKSVDTIPWTALLDRSTNDNVSMMDTVHFHSPNLCTRAVSKEDVSKGTCFLKNKGLECFATELEDWIGIGPADFIYVNAHQVIIEDVWEKKILTKALAEDWLDLDLIAEKARDRVTQLLQEANKECPEDHEPLPAMRHGLEESQHDPNDPASMLRPRQSGAQLLGKSHELIIAPKPDDIPHFEKPSPANGLARSDNFVDEMFSIHTTGNLYTYQQFELLSARSLLPPISGDQVHSIAQEPTLACTSLFCPRAAAVMDMVATVLTNRAQQPTTAVDQGDTRADKRLSTDTKARNNSEANEKSIPEP